MSQEEKDRIAMAEEMGDDVQDWIDAQEEYEQKEGEEYKLLETLDGEKVA